MIKFYFYVFLLILFPICQFINHISAYLDIMSSADQGILASAKFYSGLGEGLCIILTVIFLIIIFVVFIKKYRKSDLVFIEKSTKILKVGLMPFIILELGFKLVQFSGLFTEFFLPFEFISSIFLFECLFSTYFFLLFSSIFSIGYLKLLYKNNKIDRKTCVIYTVMQLLYVFDCISIFSIIKREKQKKIIILS